MDTHELGMNLAGHLQAESGLAEGFRSCIKAMESHGIGFTLTNIPSLSERNADVSYVPSLNKDIYSIDYLHTNPNEHYYDEFSKLNYWDNGKYKIGYWAWETGLVPRDWIPAFKKFDEIWTPSSHSASLISIDSSIPIIPIPHCISCPQPTKTKRELGLPEDKFIFLFIFDFHSNVARKNPFAVIEAFRNAFKSKNQDVVLILKINNSQTFPKKSEYIDLLIEDYSSIVRMNGYMDKNDINSLIYHCNCYISLHRSEGFGLTMAEAMFHGKPVIATGYSSNIDFMNTSNSLLVPYELVELQEEIPPYAKGSFWANPDIERTSELMRFVVENEEQAQMIGRQAAFDIHRYLSPWAVGEKIKYRLEWIINQLNDGYQTKSFERLTKNSSELRVQEPKVSLNQDTVSKAWRQAVKHLQNKGS